VNARRRTETSLLARLAERAGIDILDHVLSSTPAVARETVKETAKAQPSGGLRWGGTCASATST
jgi:hypothetical protein